ncbi:MAG: membrane dipeptidase [Bryobacterales bacterium]|nr:membrane dipeptidase [Bryobacterales bacterium]
MRPILDAHLDIAWNALSFDRDQLLDLDELRARESGLRGASRGNCTVSLPELRQANVRACLATLLSRARPRKLPELRADIGEIGDRSRGEVILREDLDYANQTIACAAAQGQLAYYQLLERQGRIRFVLSRHDLLAVWNDTSLKSPIGIILSMEGCDPIVDPDQAAWWFEQGLRTACLAHYGPSAYAMGTGGDGPLTAKGRELLVEFDRLGLILDLVHTADTALDQALETFGGAVFVSHGNCRTLVPHDRQMSDGQIRRIAERGGVIGVVMDEWMILPGYVRGEEGRDRATLEIVAHHVDHICTLLGNVDHVGIGSDLDGGFGTEQTPVDLHTIADLQRLGDILAQRGYKETEVRAVLGDNWVRFFADNLPPCVA